MFLGYNYQIMLKVLAFLAFTLYILPVQGYAQPDKTQETAKRTDPTLPAPPPITPKQDDGPNLQTKPTTHVDADVRVTSSPTKDSYDRAAFWANIVLAVAGTGGIVVAIITLCRIHRQAVEMRLQRILMQRTLNSIRKQSNLMERDFMARINKESARIFVRRTQIDSRFLNPSYVSPDDPTGGLNPEIGKFSVGFSNQGESKAYFVEWYCAVEVIGKEGKAIFREEAGDKVGVMLPNCEPLEGSVEIYPLPGELVRECIADQTATLRFHGWVGYETAFEPDKAIKIPFGWTWIEDSEWIDAEVGSADTSYWKEDEKQSQNPN
jgi:hypothetical protein